MRRFGSLFAAVALVSSALAQSAPPPPQPFPPAIESYIGRMLDSSDNDNDSPYSDVSTRVRGVVVASEIDRLYVFLNNGTLVTYRLSTLEARIASETPGTTVFGEELLTPEYSFGNSVPFWAAIADIDYDDRGYTYIAQTSQPLRILDPAFNTVTTVGEGLEYPAHVAVVRSGATYYAVVARGEAGIVPVSTSIYDVTNPAAPVLLRTFTGITLHSDDSATGHFAYYTYENGTYTLSVSTVERLLADQPPLFSAPTPVTAAGRESWTTDGTNFFSDVHPIVDTSIYVLQPQGGTYVLNQVPFPGTALPAAAPMREYFAIGPYLYRAAVAGYEMEERFYFRNMGVTATLAVAMVGSRRLLIAPAWSLLEVFALRPAEELSHHEDVPTASEWALLALTGALAALAVLRLTR